MPVYYGVKASLVSEPAYLARRASESAPTAATSGLRAASPLGGPKLRVAMAGPQALPREFTPIGLGKGGHQEHPDRRIQAENS